MTREELTIFDEKAQTLRKRFGGKTLFALFKYKNPKVAEGSPKELDGIVTRWVNEGITYLYEACLSDENINIITPLNNPIESVSYVLGEEEYIKGLEQNLNDGSLTVTGTI